MSKIWEQGNYRSNIHYLIDIPIQEFDISKANISILRDANIIPEESYQYFLQCPKIEREIAIGKMQGANPSITIALKEGITLARRKFLEQNGIKDSDVLAIRNDAITIAGNYANINPIISERIAFRPVGSYRSFYKINRLFFYYDFNIITKTEVLDIKGLGEDGIKLHKDFMLDFLSELFYTAQIESVDLALRILSNVYGQYINKTLPIGYYRELNNDSKFGSKFRLLNEFSIYDSIYIDFATEYDKRYIDISFNEQVFRELNKIYSSVWFKQKH